MAPTLSQADLCLLEWCHKMYSVLNFHALDYSFHIKLYGGFYVVYRLLGVKFCLTGVGGGSWTYCTFFKGSLSQPNDKITHSAKCILNRSSESWQPTPWKSKKSKNTKCRGPCHKPRFLDSRQASKSLRLICIPVEPRAHQSILL